MDDEKIIHTRLVTYTQPLFEELERLGYEEIKVEGHGLNKTKTFKKNNKFVSTSHNELMLFVKDKMGVPLASHVGLTVHDEMLRFFTNRTPTIVDDGKKEVS